MAIIARGTNQDYKPAPSGTHVARCVQLIDLGNQYSKFYGKTAYKVLLGFELPNQVQEHNGEPYIVWKRYTLLLSKRAALRKHLEAWRNRAFSEEELKSFDLATVVGVPCMVAIVHTTGDDDTVFANIDGVFAVPDGTVVPPQVHPSIIFDIAEWDQRIFETFSENLQNTIQTRVQKPEDEGDEYSQVDQQREERGEQLPADDIPF